MQSKKNISISIFLLIACGLLFSQQSNKEKIKSLKKEAIQLETAIQLKLDALKKIKQEIAELEKEDFFKNKSGENGSLTIVAIINGEGTLRKSSEIFADEITKLRKGEKVKLTDYRDGYWVVNSGQYFGYINEIFVKETKETEILKNEFKKVNEKMRKKEEIEKEIKRKRQVQAYRKRIINKFGKKIGQDLLDGYYWIGMTKEMTKISLGEPRNINRSVGSWGVHEQWIYYSVYLYFENGKLTSYQNSR